MVTETEVLYSLLPAYIRFQDQKGNAELQQLFGVAEAQYRLLKQDLQRMYDGWFVETCEEWLLPYIADLVGLELPQAGVGQLDPDRARRVRSVMSMRRAVANAIAQRRRKGTPWILEELASDVAHWPARAVECYRQVVVTTAVNHVQPGRLATADVRSSRALADVDTPFDPFCHIPDVHQTSFADSRGLYNVPGMALYIFRLRPYPVTTTPAYCREDVGAHCFTFSVLGNDSPLFRKPEPEVSRYGIARAENLPAPLSRWEMEQDAPQSARSASTVTALFGPGRSFNVEVADWPRPRNPVAIEARNIIPADLTDWTYKVPKDHVAVDPVLGRIAFPPSQPPRKAVKVSYHYGFAADIGGGEYNREPAVLPAIVTRLRVWATPGKRPGDDNFETIAAAFAAWRTQRNNAEASRPTPPALVVELMETGVYPGRFDLDLQPGETVAVIAAQGTRPVIWLPDQEVGAPDAIRIEGGIGSRVVLDGLLIAGRAVTVRDREAREQERGFCEVVIRHSTLVPGGALHPNCEPRRPAEPSITLENTSVRLCIEASIVGAIRVITDEDVREPLCISLSDSIVDATSDTRIAIGGPVGDQAYAELSARHCTVVGRVLVHAIGMAQDSIFTGEVQVARRQIGCMRFCFAPWRARTPKRYRCEPRTADSMVAPRFVSVRYGMPSYLRLTDCTSTAIRTGASDESEMGVYHDLFEPQRLSMLANRLVQFVPAGADGGVIPAI